MYKYSGLLLIAALVTSMIGVLAPATTVTAYTNQPTVGITETSVRDNAYVLITLTVSNPVGGENVENVLIVCENSVFTAPIGLNENVAENWDNAADNLIAIGDNKVALRTHMRNAAQHIKNAGENLVAVGGALDNAGYYLELCALDDNRSAAGSYLRYAATYYKRAGENLKLEPENFLAVYRALGNNPEADFTNVSAAYYENLAGDRLNNDNDTGSVVKAGAYIENLAWVGNLLARDNILGTMLRGIYNGLDNLREMYENAGYYLGNYPEIGAGGKNTSQTLNAANYLENHVAVYLGKAATNFRWVVENLENAAEILDNFTVDVYLGGGNKPLRLLARDSRLDAATATIDYLDEDFIEGIENFAHHICPGSDKPENLREAAQALENAIDNQTVAYWLGPLLASDIIGWYGEASTTSARYYIEKAADNLKNIEKIDLTTAGNMLYNALGRFTDAGTKIKETAALLQPAIGWGMETGALAGTNGVLFTAMSTDNHLTAGNSKTFKFLWKAPDISEDKEYTFNIYSYKVDNTCSTPTLDTVTVSGQGPKVVSFVAQQTGATTTNIAGKVLDNAKFTITLTTNEALSSIGSVYIENVNGPAGGYKSLVGPLTLTSSDNIVWTLEVDTTTWEDNWENLRVRVAAPWATDLDELENTDNATIDNFTFDVIKPRFVSNGLTTWNSLPGAVKPGTTDNYLLENDLLDTITVDARDFYRGVENAKRVTVDVYVNGSAIALDHTPEYKYTGDVTFVEGVNTVSVRTTDRVGNYVENDVNDNIYVDNTLPTVTFVSVGGVSWTDNDVRITDNTPTFRLKIQDTGWGIIRDNVQVMLDNDDNWQNLTVDNLENYGVWDNGAATGDYNFENIWDNSTATLAGGLAGGYWYINVLVSDNLHDNENFTMRFYIDVTAPSWTVTTAKAATTFYYQTTMDILDLITMTKIDSWYIEGQAQEAESTIRLYVDTTVTTATSSTTADATTGLYDYSLTVQLSEGIHAIYLQEIDKSGNESNKVLLGTYTVDKTVPVITLSAPADATTTDAAQITVSGTIVDYMGTLAGVAYDELTVTIDCTGAAVAKDVYLNADGSFSTTVPLIEGTNVINVVARDSATITSLTGNQTITTRTVTRTVTPWATYAIIIVIVALILAAIAIFRKR